MEHWWNETESKKSKEFGEKTLICQFLHYKSHINIHSTSVEPGPLWWNNND